MRVGILALVVVSSVTPSTAIADSEGRLEASGYLGVDYFGDDIGLGDSTAPEQRPQTAPAFGARLTYIAAESDREVPLALGGELELSFTPSSTGSSPDGARPSSFAPVLGYRALFLVRLGTGRVQPHIVAGVGGASQLSSSTYLARDSDLVVQWGFGATLPMADRWQLRFDARQGRSEARDGGMTSTFELLLGVGARFGAPHKAPPCLEVQVAHVPPPPPPTVHEVAAPAPMPTVAGDHAVSAPDPSADHTHRVTAESAPAAVIAALAIGPELKFVGKATLTPPSKTALDKTLPALLTNPQIKVAITAHPEGSDADAAEVAEKRAEAVKWYLVEQGVAQAQLSTKVGAVVKEPPIIELAVGK